jgi:hypothetical protein
MVQMPVVLQYNTRDLADDGIPILPIEVMDKDLNSRLKAPYFEASAFKGKGVGETLKKSIQITLSYLNKKLKWSQ